MKVTYELDERAFMDALRVLWSHRSIGSKGNLLVGAGLGLGGIVSMWRGVDGLIPPLLALGGGALIAMDRAREALWRRFFRKTKKYREPISASINEDGVCVISAEGENEVPWAHFRAFLVSSDYLFLIVNQRQISIIPRSAFNDHECRDATEALVADKLPELRRWLA